MYILKNALRCINRSKGRNILIGIIVFAITLSACIGLSIRQASETAKKETLNSMSITGTISFDRQSMMKNLNPNDKSDSGFDRDKFRSMMNDASSLTLEEYEKYAKAESVDSFYYTLTASFNGNDDFEAVSSIDSSSVETESDDRPAAFDGGGMMGIGKMRGDFVQSDFSVIGYSSEDAMTTFKDGTITITDGEVFEESTDKKNCIISDELASYNNLSVGDTVKVTNPNNEDEAYELKIVGIFTDSSSNKNSFSPMSAASNDPANKIYMSYTALNAIVEKSESVATTETDEKTGFEKSTKISASLSGTYVFKDVDSYNSFEEEVKELGLDESYKVSSQDINAYENSLTPLKTLSTMAGYFLIVILIIGAIILIVLNIFTIRERKYEIGVLTAMGMKKGKVGIQFLTEIFIVTMVAVIIGAAIGSVSSVPVTNSLLKNQVESQQQSSSQIEANFGRGDGAPGMPGGGGFAGFGSGNFGDNISSLFGGNNSESYITEVDAAMNFTVLLELVGIALILVIASGSVAMLFIMRYDPLKILSNRD